MICREDRPLVLIASSRPNGHTAALVDVAFPGDKATTVDVSALKIGYYSAIRFGHCRPRQDAAHADIDRLFGQRIDAR